MKLVELRTPSATRAMADAGQAESGHVLTDRQARSVRYLRVSLTDRCNMRCTYCMPAEGIEHVPRSEVLTLEEVVRLVEAFAAWGVERVRLTGGEPTLRRNLAWLVSQLRAIKTVSGAPLEVVLTSNGELLEALVQPLAEAGLSGLTVSLDTLDRARFRQITRRDKLDRVLAGICRSGRSRAPGQAQHRGGARLQRRRARGPVSVRLAPGHHPALHRADADGRRAAVRAW